MPITRYNVPESSTDPDAILDEVVIYAKDVGGITELFARASDGQITPLTPRQSVVVSMGNNSIGAAADTRFLDRWNSDATSPLLNTAPVVAPRDGVIRNLFVRHQAAVGNGNSVIYTVMVNGVLTPLTVTLPTGAIVQGSDLINQVPVAQGDRITVQISKPLPIGDGQILSSISMEYR